MDPLQWTGEVRLSHLRKQLDQDWQGEQSHVHSSHKTQGRQKLVANLSMWQFWPVNVTSLVVTLTATKIASLNSSIWQLNSSIWQVWVVKNLSSWQVFDENPSIWQVWVVENLSDWQVKTCHFDGDENDDPRFCVYAERIFLYNVYVNHLAAFHSILTETKTVHNYEY